MNSIDINKIYNEDSEVFLKTIPDNYIDMIMTSPPYDNLRTYDAEKNSWNFDKFKKIARELVRILKEGGVIAWNVNDKVINGSKSCTSYKQVLYFVEELGMNLNDTHIWIKENPMPVIKSCRTTPATENIYIFSKGKPKTFNTPMRKCKNSGKLYNSTAKNMDGESGRHKLVYNVNSEQIDYNYFFIPIAQNPEIEYDIYDDVTQSMTTKKDRHPAVMPLQLAEKEISMWTNKDDLVLDPFSGSGTTAVASLKLYRNYIGVEQNYEYAIMSEKRIKDFSSTQSYELF